MVEESGACLRFSVDFELRPSAQVCWFLGKSGFQPESGVLPGEYDGWRKG